MFNEKPHNQDTEYKLLALLEHFLKHEGEWFSGVLLVCAAISMKDQLIYLGKRRDPPPGSSVQFSESGTIYLKVENNPFFTETLILAFHKLEYEVQIIIY